MKNLVLTFCLLLSLVVQSQTWTTFKTNNTSTTFPNVVFSIAQDKDGSMWFGTRSGVVNFKQNNWIKYSQSDGLAHNNVNCINIDKYGNKWIGTENGLSKYNDTTWTNFNTVDGLLNNNVFCVTIDAQENKWIGTSKGISKFDGQTWTSFPTQSPVSCISIDSHNNKWIGTYGGGMLLFDNINWTTFKFEASGKSTQYAITKIFIDENDTKWIGTTTGLSMMLNNDTNFYNTDIPYASVVGILKDPNNKVFYAKSGFNITITEEFFFRNSYINTTGTESKYITSMFKDKDGNLWCGTELGVSKFDWTTWTNYYSNGISGNEISAICVDNKGNKWFGNSKYEFGLSKLDNNNHWTRYAPKDGLLENDINCLSVGLNDTLWVGGVTGFSRYDGKHWDYFLTTFFPAIILLTV